MEAAQYSKPDALTARARSALVLLMLLTCTLVAACSHDLDDFVLPDAAGGSDAPGGPDAPAGTDAVINKDAPPDLSVDLNCLAPKIACSGVCVDPSSDEKHCGGCDKACPANTNCKSSQCECLLGYGDCDTNPQNGCEAQLSTDVLHCDGCNKACPSKHICVSASCRCDPNTAGSCGSTGQYCSSSSGSCLTCDKTRLNCDLKGDCECVGKCSGSTCDSTCTYGAPNQCGSVYHACTSNGVCTACAAGTKNCDRQSGCGTPESTPCT
jgi:Stigma-specific protein, Stig1